MKTTIGFMRAWKLGLKRPVRNFRMTTTECKPVCFMNHTPIFGKPRKRMAASFTNCVFPGFFDRDTYTLKTILEGGNGR